MGTRSTAAAAALGPRIRQRKLNTKSQLAILREDQLDDLDHDPHQNLSEVNSGVEREEEKVRFPLSVFSPLLASFPVPWPSTVCIASLLFHPVWQWLLRTSPPSSLASPSRFIMCLWQSSSLLSSEHLTHSSMHSSCHKPMSKFLCYFAHRLQDPLLARYDLCPKCPVF